MRKTNQYMASVFISLCSMIFLTPNVCAEELSLAAPGTLVFDEPKDLNSLRSFRLMSSPFKKNLEPAPSREGLDDLKLSASAQFSEKTITAVIPKMQGDIWILDLRREAHGFIDGVPISWYAIQNQSNLGLSLHDIQKSELAHLNALKTEDRPVVYEVTKKIEGTILNSDPVSINIKRTESEQQLSERLKLKYKRLPVSDHQRPSDEQVDEFVQFYQNLPKDAWIHMHCRGGKGRTTTFLMMVDMMNNAKKVTLADIAARHVLLGGSDLLNLSDEPEKEWKQDWAKQRKSFVELFYHYAKSNHFPQMTWTDWLKQQTATLQFEQPK